MSGFDVQPGMRMMGGGGAFSPAVNGKMPIAAWIPSRDEAGNGTTTLTDLVGSNNGTLTNMDAGSDWVADTDAGGVRALDFDGINDQVAIPSISAINGILPEFGLSIWFKISAADGTYQTIIEKANVSDYQLWIARWPTLDRVRIHLMGTAIGFVPVDVGEWHHLSLSWSEGYCQVYSNGALLFNIAVASLNFSAAYNLHMGYMSGYSWAFEGRIDDFRVFVDSLDATDVADLYAGGLGRGVHAS